MRFEELTVQDQDDELRLPFHPQLTVLAGLGPDERAGLTDSILGSLAGGVEQTTLRYLDATGNAVTVEGRAGRITARHDDGTPVPEPIGSVATSRESLRALMVIRADDVGPEIRRSPEDEPPELREARDTLEALTAELDAARAEGERTAGLRAELHELEAALRSALEGIARREYAQVLANVERVRAEAAAVQSDESEVEADQRLLAMADQVRELARHHSTALAHAEELRGEALGSPFDEEERERLLAVPDVPPEGLGAAAEALRTATVRRLGLEQRLQDLAVAQLPAPSDPVVAELGVMDQEALWAAAAQLTAAREAMLELRVSLGGLELDDLGAAPALVADIEAAHAAVDEADRAAAAVRRPAIAATALGIVAGLLAVAVAPLLVLVGLGAAIVAAVAGIVVPDRRRSRAARAEQAALDRAGASSYLGFHIRRVEATVDPRLRETAEGIVDQQREAWEAWTALVGTEVPAERAGALEGEIRAYHRALRDLGETADEMDQLRGELDQEAIPQQAAARAALADLCAPYLLEPGEIDDPHVVALVEEQCRRGASARAQDRLHRADVVADASAEKLEHHLVELGLDRGDLDHRLGAFEWAVTRADEREDARRRARPRAEIESELAELTALANELRQPEWEAVTAAEAEAPDVEELEARRDVVAEALAGTGAEADLDRLADRHMAASRRVAALEARLGAGTSGDPGALADLQSALLARLTGASQAGPGGDSVPVILDEVFQRVPPDRSWDLLDLVLRLAERHQMVYLTDDAFVAAWARQRALDGTIRLLETDSGADTAHETV